MTVLCGCSELELDALRAISEAVPLSPLLALLLSFLTSARFRRSSGPNASCGPLLQPSEPVIDRGRSKARVGNTKVMKQKRCMHLFPVFVRVCTSSVCVKGDRETVASIAA